MRAFAVLTLGAAVTLTACREDPLSVENLNQPDVERAFATARLTETIISKLFQQMFNGQYGVFGNSTWPAAMVMAFESSSQLGNFGMGTRSSIPRPIIDNSIGNREAGENFRDYDHLSRNARLASNAIVSLQEFRAAGLAPGPAARDAKALSFAFFNLGYAHGHLSLVYDSAAVLSPEFVRGVRADIAAGGLGDSVPPLSHSSVVNANALAFLDSALAFATGPDATTGTGGWPIPATNVGDAWWYRGAVDITLEEWIRIIRSYKAKFRAGVARTPTEREAVIWSEVIGDATNGITSDLTVLSTQSGGWFQNALWQLSVSASWSQMTPMILGMADTSGAYTAWLQQPLNSRSPFLMHTPDKRFPTGATRAAQLASTGGNLITGPTTGTIQYFRNRPPGGDAANYAWGEWFYDNHRFWNIRGGSGNGLWVIMSKAEIDMLAAEGYIRTGQVAQAVPLINFYRTRAGLQPIPATGDVNTVVPGGAGCVPRVPVAAADPPTTTCGNVFEAMKWEKRLETAFTGHAQWFIDSRGWGDLYKDTPLEWPVPYQELFARQRDTYTNERRAGLGTYGFGRSATY